MTKYIFVTGGVVSSLGKGICASSLGTLLKAHGYSVAPMKLDPYINVDPGTMNPIQHGEVFVTYDGAETDLDLGYYERFIGTPMSRKNNFTSGQVYDSIISKERAGKFLGQTVQVIPHITDEIQAKIKEGTEGFDIGIIEIGGTVGDIESLPFLEAIRQMGIRLGHNNRIFIHLTLLPHIATTGEYKTKPTQHSVAHLRSIGIQPDLLLCRCQTDIEQSDLDKIALFSNLSNRYVFSIPDSRSIYQIPLLMRKNKIDQSVLEQLQLKHTEIDLSEWEQMVDSILRPSTVVKIAIVGKYIGLTDAYKSINEALIHAGAVNGVSASLIYVDAEEVNATNVEEKLQGATGILVPGGFGTRGVNGKMEVIRYARKNDIPFFGICMGMQIAVIEFARNVVKLPSADSTEFSPDTDCPIISLTSQWQYRGGQMAARTEDEDMGATMRLGEYECRLAKSSLAQTIYQKPSICERHRHRYEFNIQYKQQMEECGMVFSGISAVDDLVEIIELPSCRWFLACQFHPEFLSSPLGGHPIFNDFIKASLK